ncbi:HepT-like ribonuclease domain-containing protein [Azospirillum rugosum]|uniref:Uncharacterized protein with HEPN domain n=1 Tax=Azospirillum rugosum TaxID=416170 RepID=A0ABS4SLW2_9PROT|nr:HepT-like ribonuclease domain-containing protein [Azospirillum rugosum]MBP2293510.1 uncharacterized protein with HEPN domain [Azospirillum rugosum]MDQ0529189.1 uncharacterized protein with HEPN domain [Azospirillum rugosum]
MPSRSPRRRLEDILQNIDAIVGFIAGMSFDEFLADQKTSYAVLRALEIISEASRRVPDVVKARHAHIDWRAVAGAGNIYRHDYDTVDDALTWHTIQHELAPLRAVVALELTLIEGDGP